MQTVTLDHIRAAAARLHGTALRTPLLRLPLPGEVYAKCENLQRTGSFKLRGAFNFLSLLDPDARARGVVAHSSGNHAQGVAWAARAFGVPATIVIPDDAPAVKVARTRALGAEVVRCANSAAARAETAQVYVEKHGRTLVPPFDHPWIVAGQGTVGLEIHEQLPGVANVLVCVGGGGLAAGIGTALAALAPEARVFGVEPEWAADAAESFRRGERVRWEAAEVIRTVADGVRTQEIGALNFAIIRERLRGFVTVPDERIVDATRWYAAEARLVVEPTGALTLAAYRQLTDGAAGDAHGSGGEKGGVRLADGPTVLLISGGNVDLPRLADILAAGAPTADPPAAERASA